MCKESHRNTLLHKAGNQTAGVTLLTQFWGLSGATCLYHLPLSNPKQLKGLMNNQNVKALSVRISDDTAVKQNRLFASVYHGKEIISHEVLTEVT